MNNSLIKYSLIMLVGVLISSISQISLKKAANRKYNNFISQYLNARVIVSYLFFFGATLCTVFAYKGIPLSMGPILESMSYVFVAVLGHFFLQDQLTRKKIIALIVIISGVFIYAIS